MSKTSNELASEVATDFRMTFHQDADGGPQHLLYTLRGFCVILKKDGQVVADGEIAHTEYNDEVVELFTRNEETDQYDGPIVRIPWGTFDEVMYL